MNIYQKLLMTTVGVALSLTVVESKPVQATTFTYAYQTFDPDPAGTQNKISGTFQFSDTGPGSTLPLTDFTLNWLDASSNIIASFTGADFAEKPSVVFVKPVSLVYALTGGVSGKVDDLTTSGSFSFPNISLFGFSGNLVGPNGVVATCRFCQVNKLQLISKSEPVPEPEMAIGLGVLSFAGLFLGKRGVLHQKCRITD